MLLKTVQIRNFMSVGDEITFPLDTKGLVLISGENRDEDNADSNGAGKSVPLDALVWGLWGQTVRGLSADEVVHRKVRKNCRVVVELEDGGKTIMVTRTREDATAPKSNDLLLSIDGTDCSASTNVETQAKIDSILGIDFISFCASMPGAGVRLATMTDKEIKLLLERILKVEEYSEAYKLALAKETEITKAVAVAETELSSLDKRITQSRQFEVHLAKMRAALEAHKQAKINATLRVIADQLVSRDDATAQLETLLRQSEALSGKDLLSSITNLSYEVFELDKQIDAQRGKLHKLETTHAGMHSTVSTKLKLTKDQRKSLKGLAGTCPVCLSEVSVEHKTKVDTALGEEETKLTRKAKKLNEQKDALSVEILEAVNSLTASRRTKQSMLETAKVEYDKLSKISSEIEEIQDSITFKSEYVGDLFFSLEKEKSTPIEPLLPDEDSVSVEDLEKEREQLVISLEELRTQLACVQFWVKSFSPSGLRSYVLESVVPYLNTRAEYYCTLLTGGTMKIQFSTKTKQKSGKVVEKFSINVTLANGAGSWTGASLGERARIDLVLSLVIGDLAGLQSSKGLSFRFMDEPFENIDKSGIDAILSLIADQQKAYSSVYIVTHKDYFKDLATSSIKLVKEDGFTRLEA